MGFLLLLFQETNTSSSWELPDFITSDKERQYLTFFVRHLKQRLSLIILNICPINCPVAVRDMPWLWEQSALEAHFPGVALGGTVCLCQLTERHLGVKFLPLLPPSFQRLVNKLLSFTTNNLTPSPEVLLQVLLLRSRTGQEPSLPFALCASREEGWVLCPRPEPRRSRQHGWGGKQC